MTSSLEGESFFFCCIMFFLWYFHRVMLNVGIFFCVMPFFFLYYVFSFDIFIGVCFPLVFSPQLCVLFFFSLWYVFLHWYFHWIMSSFGIFSFIILNCFSFVISFPHWIMFSVGIFSCVMLIRQQTCATVGTSYQPAGSYHNYLQPFSRETWANMAHNRIFGRIFFWQYFPLLNCFSGLILPYSIIQFSPPL